MTNGNAVLIALALAGLSAGPLVPASNDDLSLFDRESIYGWTQLGTQSWRASAGTLIAPPDGRGEIQHNAVFGDFRLTAELRVSPGAEVAIAAGVAPGNNPASNPCTFRSTDYHLKTEGWQSLEIIASGDLCSIGINSHSLKVVRRIQRAGHIILARRGRGEVFFRNIRLKPLNLRGLFDGSKLAGWRPVVSPNIEYGEAVWTVREDAIHVEPGQGALESNDLFSEFILQMEIRTEPRPRGPIPNSGVFLRGTPGVFWSGYEVQIRNTAADKYGTGGLYNIQRARAIVAKDGEWFTLTVSAYKRHFSVWVNGVQVNDWEDPHPEGDSVRKQLAMLGPGSISLQAHDPGSPMSFRRIRVGLLEFP